MKRILKDNENRICLILFAITMAVAMLPLVSRYCINGHDLEYHLLRIESLKEGIKMGKPFLKVNALFFGGAGYASSMFYSDLFMYIPAILRVCGLSIGASYHIFVAFMFVITYASTYYCTMKMLSSKYAGTVAAILLTLCPYHMDDMLVRAACGEYMAFVFIPFVIYGIYNCLFEDFDRPWIIGVGFGGLILTHPATLVLNIIFCAVTFLVYIRVFIRNPKRLVRLCLVAGITLFATSFYWIPMLEQMLSQTFYVSNDSIDMLDAALPMGEIFSQIFPGVGVLLITIAMLRVFVSSKDYPVLRYADVLICGGVIYAIGASNMLPWNRLSRFLSFVQFPWRLFTMTSVLLAIADAIVIYAFIKSNQGIKSEIALFIVISISSALCLNHSAENMTGYYDYGNNYYDYKPYTANVIGGEWLPISVTDRDSLVALSEHAFLDNGAEIDFDRSRAVITMLVPEGVGYVDVPFIYYKGYSATLTGDTVNKLTVSGEGIDGMCRVYTNGNAGRLDVEYTGTVAQIVSYILSAITIIGLFIFCYVYKRNKRSAQ